METLDNRFIMKEISEEEHKSFVEKIAPKYVDSLKATYQTCLANFFGVYEV